MKYRFFHVLALDPQAGETALNDFCARHRVSTIDKSLVVDGPDSYWTFCVGYLDGTEKSPVTRKGRIDYREVLNEADFTVFAKLRSLRKGLPIGTLTSQHFANFYLDGLDRFLLEEQRVKAHVRYMDDIIWWCESRKEAKAQLAVAGEFATKQRLLVVKPNPQINRSARGVTFCGYRIFPGALRLSRRRCQCYERGRTKWESTWLRGDISALDLQAAYAAIYSTVAYGDTGGWRREQLLRNPAPEV